MYSELRNPDGGERQVGLELTLPSEKYTETLGAFLALNSEVGDALLLHGDLGSGKTTFARGYIRCFLGDPNYFVTSPTYLLDNAYPDEGNSILEGVAVHHLDLWRLQEGDTRSRQVADFDLLFEQSVTLIEWPSRLAESDMPRSRLDIYLTAQENGRTARLTGTGSRWEEQLDQLKKSCSILPGGSNLELPLSVVPDDCWL
ncbi:hypothetical protein NDN08_004002 [Rhodosorus marinus]|uniref:tRNA threonylcarbamoyladenosine biosynthesis protein TsaE n=1 Tax=Rhodosorus marinus TaxID=101924 RepID=A0AAV8UMD2_9RHOD|nr:hypothetical protein NDN08_004002 [Rhodosorus marinus]